MAKKATKKTSKKALVGVKTEMANAAKFKIVSEFRNLLPKLAAVEYEALEDSIKREGLREPLVIWKERGILVDGHNRRDICKDNKIKLRPRDTREQSFENKKAVKLWILDNQAGRRNTTLSNGLKPR